METQPSFEDLKEDVTLAAKQVSKKAEKELGRVRKSIVRTANQVSTNAKRHPGWTAGLMFGAGALLGAGLFALLRPRPTGAQLFGRGLRNAWGGARDFILDSYDRMAH